MAPPLLHLQNIALTLGGAPLLAGAELAVEPGDRLCLVGRNGSGKSTLLKIAAGLLESDGGTRFFQPGATIRYLPQEPDFAGFATTLAYAEAGLGPTDDPHRARYLLERLGLTGEEDPAKLSGGEARRAALARTLAPDPDILLLDEPTNHLDLPAIEWLEEELAAVRGALVLISHDRRFLQDLTRATVWLDRGLTRRLDRGFGEFEAWRDKVLEEEEAAAHKLDRKIVAEEHWVRYGVSGRRKRNMRRMAELGELRRAKREARRVEGAVQLQVSEAQLSGKLVIDAEGLSKSFGERAIVKNLSLRVLRGDRLGLVGANGAGKTTLVNLLTGKLAPDAGQAKIGANVEMATLDQSRAALDPADTVANFLTGGGGDWVEISGKKKHVVGYMQDFLFKPEQARTPVSRLSGGERARLMLARALALPSNFLVLDEPTNDLDLETLDLVEEMLADYPGTVLVVSHDRDFLDRVATSVLVAEGEGNWIEYAGGYSDMVAQRGAGVGARAMERPKTEAKPKQEPRQEPKQKRKLSFNEKHALENLPAEMERLRGIRDKAQAILADPDLFTREPKKFEQASATLAKIDADLAAAEDRWLELEMLREELEG
ncbi:MAG: ATP-binding cassette domain-containing protein [Methylobacteriaceae bacterium]|nr:ATP-binding cassette domain-containing protein [Methylobacteriaceae bacterium]